MELRFDAEQAPYIKERTWHPSQTFGKTKDDRLRMRLEVSSTPELLLWLVGRAEGMEVVGPPELRGKVHDILQRATARHES